MWSGLEWASFSNIDKIKMYNLDIVTKYCLNKSVCVCVCGGGGNDKVLSDLICTFK
jgi:hypothetical protein